MCKINPLCCMHHIYILYLPVCELKVLWHTLFPNVHETKYPVHTVWNIHTTYVDRYYFPCLYTVDVNNNSFQRWIKYYSLKYMCVF